MNRLKSSEFMKEHFPFFIQRVVHDYLRFPSMHGHDFVEFVYVVSGEAKHCFGDEQYDIQSGDAFFINPGEEHAYAFEPDQTIEIINCLFMPSLIHDALLRELGISQSMDYFYVHPFLNNEERFHHRLNLRGHEAVTVLSILDNMIVEQTHKHPGYDKLIRLRMVELQILLSRYYSFQQQLQRSGRHGERDMTVKRIRGYLERYYNRKITLDTLSSIFNISVRQMNRLMKQETGASVIEWLHHIRIEKAKHYLTRSHEKVIAVANLVGYDDPAFFSRLFTRIVGISPGKYRNQHGPSSTTVDESEKSKF